jgi:hypothetical protein
MGDRWKPDNLKSSTYIWLPLELSGTNVRLTNRVNWVPNAAQRTWSVAPSETSHEGESAALSGGARSVSCSGCSGSSAAGYIGGSSGGKLSISGVSSQATTRSTLRFKHANGDSAERFATVTVNGVSQKVGFVSTGDGQSPGSSSVHVDLVSGQTNTITITTTDGTWGPDVDRIFVPVT